MRNSNKVFLRKYRILVIAIAFFVVIDLGLISYNLYASYEIDQLTAARDLSGSVHSSSQILLRSLLEIESDRQAGFTDQPTTQRTVVDRANLIQQATEVFKNGGRLAISSDSPNYRALSTPRTIEAAEKFISVWASYYELLHPLLQNNTLNDSQLTAVITYARSNNSHLFGAINELVQETQNQVIGKTQDLRTAQIVGVSLTLLNFLLTVLLALRRLLTNDRLLAKTQKETSDILATVKEGLFLLTPDFRVGEQMSASLKDIMRYDIHPGEELLEILVPMVEPKVLAAAKDYIGLLFGKRVKESLIYSLNPLAEVAVKDDSQQQNADVRYLNFQFNRVFDAGQVTCLLVTVQDVTERVKLSTQVATAKQRTREEMRVLLRTLTNDQTEVEDFLRRTESALEKINDILRTAARRSGENYPDLVDSVFRSMHAIKSEAAALNLEIIEGLAHDFEETLVALRDSDTIDGSDMVKITLHLDDLYDCLNSVKEFLDYLSHNVAASNSVKPSERLTKTLTSLAQRISQEVGSKVKITTDFSFIDKLPNQLVDELRDIGFQLLRNAIAHGIEAPEERIRASKSAIGVVHFACREIDNGTIEYLVRDDGRGLAPSHIRQALGANGQHSPEEVANMSDRDVIMKIFEPGFSTKNTKSRDAGHGVGMDVVRRKVNGLFGHISLSTQPQRYTEFRIRMPITNPVIGNAA